eukprot:scaffold146125_cov30-Tisochrysis_lutea.AAC.3
MIRGASLLLRSPSLAPPSGVTALSLVFLDSPCTHALGASSAGIWAMRGLATAVKCADSVPFASSTTGALVFAGKVKAGTVSALMGRDGNLFMGGAVAARSNMGRTIAGSVAGEYILGIESAERVLTLLVLWYWAPEGGDDVLGLLGGGDDGHGGYEDECSGPVSIGGAALLRSRPQAGKSNNATSSAGQTRRRHGSVHRTVPTLAERTSTLILARKLPGDGLRLLMSSNASAVNRHSYPQGVPKLARGSWNRSSANGKRCNCDLVGGVATLAVALVVLLDISSFSISAAHSQSACGGGTCTHAGSDDGGVLGGILAFTDEGIDEPTSIDCLCIVASTRSLTASPDRVQCVEAGTSQPTYSS